MASSFPAVLAGSGAAAAASLVGVALVHLRPAWTRASALPLAAFAGGAILGAAFLHLLPEAIDRAGEGAAGWALAAFFTLYVLETHIVPHPHQHAAGEDDGDHPHEHLAAAKHAAVPGEAHAAHLHVTSAGGAGTRAGSPFALIAAIAFGIHSAFDGFALGVGFSPGVDLGRSAALGVLAHKVPEGIALAALLLRGGLRATRALAIAAVIALLTPATAIAAFTLFTGDVSEIAMGRVLALVAGAFVYIASADLLPEVAHHPRLSRSILMLAGALVAALVRLTE